MDVLVAGAGSMGRNHCRAYSANARVDHVFVYEPYAESRAALEAMNLEKVVFIDSIADAKANGIQAASVVTPTDTHFSVASDLVGAGIDVLVEKPITTTLEQGRELASAAHRSDVLVMPGHIERFNPAVRALKKNMSSLGTIVYASAHRFGIPTNRRLADAFLDQAVHDMDVLSYLTGEAPRDIRAISQRILDAHANDLCSAIVHYDGFYATIEANRVTPIKTRELIVLGTKGSARLDYISQELVVMHSEASQTKFSSFDEILMRVGRGTEVHPYFQKDEPLRVELDHFLACSEGKEKPLVTAEDGIRAVAAVAAGMKSAKDGTVEKIGA
ncbi:Gfo/Idh/MocA family oxidoreductase [Candidatus Micrarchaeota archaeon]|nr:Gfo/Idh/MocA family oxidoreductase [Candidatus Micrarchaeota archaeon]